MRMIKLINNHIERERTMTVSLDDIPLRLIDGHQPLSDYAARSCLVVNVASQVRPDSAVHGTGSCIRTKRAGGSECSAFPANIQRPGAGQRQRDRGTFVRFQL